MCARVKDAAAPNPQPSEQPPELESNAHDNITKDIRRHSAAIQELRKELEEAKQKLSTTSDRVDVTVQLSSRHFDRLEEKIEDHEESIRKLEN